LNQPVTLTGAFELLSDRELLAEEMENLESLLETPRRAAVYAHFGNRFLTQPDEQLGGVRETIGNYLQYFLTPEVAEVFCTGESTFDFAAIDQGKIILTTMPQKFQTERRYVNTLLKLLYYNHALRRFDKTKADRAKNNLLILWADEAQRFMTASEDGTSDYNCVDVIREAGATVVAAAQSTTSLVPPLGNDKAKVLTLNLRNRLIFRAADEADAVQAADFIGKKRVVKRSWGFSAGKRNVNYSETEEHKIKPHKLRKPRARHELAWRRAAGAAGFRLRPGGGTLRSGCDWLCAALRSPLHFPRSPTTDRSFRSESLISSRLAERVE
jgi:type IV secretory pathway TraG/TraD family ATPase VirD4